MKKSILQLGKVLDKKEQSEIQGGTAGNISSLFSNVLYTPRFVDLSNEEES